MHKVIHRFRFYSLCLQISLLVSGLGVSTFVSADSNYFIEDKISQSWPNKSEIVWLKTNEKRQIFSLFSPSKTTKIQGGVVILSDLYQTPNLPSVIHEIRTTLPDYGWDTLSIQPVIPIDSPTHEVLNAVYKLSTERIMAAINHFKSNNISNIVLLGIGQSANFSLKFVPTLAIEENIVQALVIIQAFDSKWYTSSEGVKEITLPLLDISAEHDSRVVLDSAKKRLIAANFAGKLRNIPKKFDFSSKVQTLAINKTGNLRYRQVFINGANFKFEKQEQLLIKTIRGWLAKYAAGAKVTVQ